MGLIQTVLGSAYLSVPKPRIDFSGVGEGCVGPFCSGPCEKPRDQVPPAELMDFSRGAEILLQWPRLSHAGGFVRISWASYMNSNDMEEFDRFVDRYLCYESECGPEDPKVPNGADKGALCQTTVQVPLHLPNGPAVMQWAHFGGGSSLGDYYSCVDVLVTGGPVAAPLDHSVFYGGDFASLSDKECKFFNTNQLGICVEEPCIMGKYPGQHFGVPKKSSEIEPDIRISGSDSISLPLDCGSGTTMPSLYALCNEGKGLKCIHQCCPFYVNCDKSPRFVQLDGSSVCFDDRIVELNSAPCEDCVCFSELLRICIGVMDKSIHCIGDCVPEYLLCENQAPVSPVISLPDGIVCSMNSIMSTERSSCGA